MPVTRVGHIAITQNRPERLEQNKLFFTYYTSARRYPCRTRDDAVVYCPLQNHSFHVINVHRVNLSEGLIQDISCR